MELVPKTLENKKPSQLLNELITEYQNLEQEKKSLDHKKDEKRVSEINKRLHQMENGNAHILEALEVPEEHREEYKKLDTELEELDYDFENPRYGEIMKRKEEIFPEPIFETSDKGDMYRLFSEIDVSEINLSTDWRYTNVMKVTSDGVFELIGGRISDETDEDFHVEKLDKAEAMEKLKESQGKIQEEIKYLNEQSEDIKRGQAELEK